VIGLTVGRPEEDAPAGPAVRRDGVWNMDGGVAAAVAAAAVAAAPRSGVGGHAAPASCGVAGAGAPAAATENVTAAPASNVSAVCVAASIFWRNSGQPEVSRRARRAGQ